MQNLITHLIVTFIYLAVAADFWRANKPAENQVHLKLHSTMIALGLVVHGWLLHQSIFSYGFNLGFYESISAILWLTVLIYWTASFFYKLDGLQTCLMPMAVLGVALAQLLPPAYLAYDFHQPALLLHIAVSLLAYSLLLIAAILAVMMPHGRRLL